MVPTPPALDLQWDIMNGTVSLLVLDSQGPAGLLHTVGWPGQAMDGTPSCLPVRYALCVPSRQHTDLSPCRHALASPVQLLKTVKGGPGSDSHTSTIYVIKVGYPLGCAWVLVGEQASGRDRRWGI